LKKLTFPKPFEHVHPPVRNANELFEERMSLGQRTADWVAAFVGSWRFIIAQSVILVIWVDLNVTALIKHWDPYPFILMNLVLSLQAAVSAPVLMMSQNRQAAKDRIEAHIDFLVNEKAEEEVRAILNHLAAQNEAIEQIHQLLVTLQAGIKESDSYQGPNKQPP